MFLRRPAAYELVMLRDDGSVWTFWTTTGKGYLGSSLSVRPRVHARVCGCCGTVVVVWCVAMVLVRGAAIAVVVVRAGGAVVVVATVVVARVAAVG